MTVRIVQGDARQLDGIADGSVAAIITSPPYPGQRVYEDDGKPIEGQIGAEQHPQEYLENLWACCKEWWRVLDDRGSLFVNLGDKRAASGAPGTTSGLGSKPQGKRTGIDSGYSRSHFGRPKSRQMIPERFAIGCEDGRADPEGIGWIVRQTFLDGVVPLTWEKANGLPESVTDRTRDNWEVIYHLTKSERYYSAVDELREPQQVPDDQRWQRSAGSKYRQTGQTGDIKSPPNPLGRLPGSVWRIATEPLTIPDWAKAKYNLPSHFAAFPSEIPRRLILGWSPPAICLTCGEGRWPVVDRRFDGEPNYYEGDLLQRTILGYACACTPTRSWRRPSAAMRSAWIFRPIMFALRSGAAPSHPKPPKPKPGPGAKHKARWRCDRPYLP